MIQIPKLPENYTFITARNIPGKNRFLNTAMPILADSNLSYIGEPVALLLGPDKIKLEDLAEKCIVVTDEEEPQFIPKKSPQGLIRDIYEGNIEQAFDKDDLVVTSSYSTGIQDHWYAEPAGAISFFSEEKNERKEKKEKRKEGKKTGSKKNLEASSNDNEQNSSLSSLFSPHSSLVIKTATQWPGHVKKCVAQTLGIDTSFITVETTALSLHMDGKLWFPSLVACHAAIGTYITKFPVRLILNREEDFFFSPKRCASTIDIVSTINKNGQITAAKIDVSVNLGAYEIYGNEILDQLCSGVSSLYKIENFKLIARANCTNLPPQGPFSGFGLSQGLFAMERHASIIADMLGIDPLLWRKENLNQGTGYRVQGSGGTFPAHLIDTVTKRSDYFRKWTAYELLRQANKEAGLPEKNESPRGIGISAGFQGNGLLYNDDEAASYTVEVTLTKESKLEIKTNIASSEDYGKIWEKIARETISIEPDMVSIITENSGNKDNDIPDCGPSCSSRNITVITKLVEKCCMAIRKQRFHSPLPITVRRSIKAPSRNCIDSSVFAKPGYACAVVEVGIDLVECTPKIRGVWLEVDGGKIISKNRARRALSRGVVQALGWAFTEYIEYANGALTKNQYDTFSIPSPVEIPPIHVEFFENDKSEPKGIGELPFTCVPSAFLQAVSQAMDHAFKNIPLKRHEIWEMIRIRGKNRDDD